MTLILPQSKFKAIPPKDVGADVFLGKADVSPYILGFNGNNLYPMILMDLILTFLRISVKRPFQKSFTPPIL